MNRVVSEIVFQPLYPDKGTQLHERCDCSAKGAEFAFCKLFDRSCTKVNFRAHPDKSRSFHKNALKHEPRSSVSISPRP